MTEKELADWEKLQYGAAGVAAIVTGLAILIHVAGLQEVFISTEPHGFVFEILLGWTIMWALVFAISGIIQWLSYHLPIPPVVK